MKTYRISELARRLGLSRSTLLYYDRIGLLTPNGRSESEYRIYTQDNLNRLERICFFREAGLGLEEIGRILDHSQTENSILEKRLQKTKDTTMISQFSIITKTMVLGLLIVVCRSNLSAQDAVSFRMECESLHGNAVNVIGPYAIG